MKFNISKKWPKGFTIAEIVVIISVIAILATIGIVSYGKVQQRTRDHQRTSQATLIAESLEKYYDKNGAYPSCSNFSTSSDIISNLGNIDSDILIPPKATTKDITSTFKCSDLPTLAANDIPSATNDVFTYHIINAQGKWELEYYKEISGIDNIKNRRELVVINEPIISTEFVLSIDIKPAGAVPYASIKNGATILSVGTQYPFTSNTDLTLDATSVDITKYTFNKWTGDCNASGQVTMTAAKSCTANYTEVVAIPNLTLAADSSIINEWGVIAVFSKQNAPMTLTSSISASSTTFTLKIFNVTTDSYVCAAVDSGTSLGCTVNLTNNTNGKVDYIYEGRAIKSDGTIYKSNQLTIPIHSLKLTATPDSINSGDSTQLELISSTQMSQTNWWMSIHDYTNDAQLAFEGSDSTLSINDTPNLTAPYHHKYTARILNNDKTQTLVETEIVYVEVKQPVAATYTLATESNPDGLVIPTKTAGASFASGTSVTVGTNYVAGYTFTGWNGAGCNASANLSNTFNMPAANTTCTANYTAIDKPSAPNVSVYPAGAEIDIAVSEVTCNIGQAEYEVRGRYNDGSWDRYEIDNPVWSTNRNFYDTEIPFVSGKKYAYQARSRCKVSDTETSGPSIDGPEGYYFTAPTMTSVSSANAATDSLWYWDSVSCPASGSTWLEQHYYTDYPFDDGWTHGSYDVGNIDTYYTATDTSYQRRTAWEGFTYTVEVRAKCILNGVSSGWSNPTQSADFSRPFTAVATPAKPTGLSVSVNTPNSNSIFSRTNASCATGTIAYQYYYRDEYDSANNVGWTATGTSSYSKNSSHQGYSYKLYYRAKCVNGALYSAWVTASATYARPVSAPSTPSFGLTKTSSTLITLSAASSCGAGVTLLSKYDVGSWTHAWKDTQDKDWYNVSHGGIWLRPTWGNRGNTFTQQIEQDGSEVLSTGDEYGIYVKLKCTNLITNVESSVTTVSSGYLYLP